MRLTPSTTVRALALVAALSTAFVAAGSVPLRADATDDQIAALKALEKDEGKCIAKMQELKDSSDARVWVAIKEIATKSKSDKLACAAIRMVANRKDLEFLKWLIGNIEDKDLFDLKDGRPDLYKCILDALPEYKGKAEFKPAVAKLEKVIKRFLQTNGEYGSRAIRAYGTYADPAIVDQLLEWLKLTDSHGQSQGGKNESEVTKKAKADCNKAILEALNELTAQDIGDAATWEKFWADHKKGFKFPDPNKKEPEVDIGTLKEYTDPSYGYTLKRPDGGGWHFQGKDDFCRVRLVNKDEQNVEWGRVDWTIHNTSTSTPKDIKGLADWWMTKGLIDEIGEFAKAADGKPDGKPTQSEVKIAGRDWIYIHANGLAQKNREAWGSMERQIYMTKCDYMGSGHLILCAQLVLRNGADPTIATKFHDHIYGVTLKVSGK